MPNLNWRSAFLFNKALWYIGTLYFACFGMTEIANGQALVSHRDYDAATLTVGGLHLQVVMPQHIASGFKLVKRRIMTIRLWNPTRQALFLTYVKSSAWIRVVEMPTGYTGGLYSDEAAKLDSAAVVRKAKLLDELDEVTGNIASAWIMYYAVVVHRRWLGTPDQHAAARAYGQTNGMDIEILSNVVAYSGLQQLFPEVVLYRHNGSDDNPTSWVRLPSLIEAAPQKPIRMRDFSDSPPPKLIQTTNDYYSSEKH